MIAAGILGGLGLVFMQLAKEQSKQTVQSKIDSDFAQAKQDIASILSNPANCNANFFGKLGTANQDVAGIFTCNAMTPGSCRPGAPVAKYPERTGTNWAGTGISDRVRVSTVTVSVLDIDPVAPATLALTTASLTVTMETKAFNQVVKAEKALTFSTPVVYNGTSVVGCPKVWNSTVIY